MTTVIVATKYIKSMAAATVYLTLRMRTEA